MTMLSTGVLRVASRSCASSGRFTMKAGTAPFSPFSTSEFCNRVSGRLTEGRRYISVYGYTQAKALVYSKYGEPKDVLQYVGTLFLFSVFGALMGRISLSHCLLTPKPASINTPSPLPMVPRSISVSSLRL